MKRGIGTGDINVNRCRYTALFGKIGAGGVHCSKSKINNPLSI
jgi:hypothetical protein